MRIPHLTHPDRSEFYPLVHDALRKLGNQLPLNVSFAKDGGYCGSVKVRIQSSTELEFESDQQLSDWTRFPARIRAACTALRDCGVFGSFRITHQDAQLTIAPA